MTKIFKQEAGASQHFIDSYSSNCSTPLLLRPREFNPCLVALQSLNLGAKRPSLSCLTIRKEYSSFTIRKRPPAQIIFEEPRVEPLLESPVSKPKSVSVKSGVVKCQMCGKEFQNTKQLGGHMSRAHKGQSQSYKVRMEVRDKRTLLRELHQKAKDRFCEIYGIKFKNCDRSMMQKFKHLKRDMLR